MKENDIYKITMPKWEIKPLVPTRIKSGVLGFDTETNKKGKLTLIACSDETYEVNPDYFRLLEFLTNKKNKKTFNFFFNLEFDTNAIISKLPFKNQLDLSLMNSTTLDHFRIEIIPKKRLRIMNDRLDFVTNFFDISSFYQIGTLEETSAKTFKTGYTKRMSAKDGIEVKDIGEEEILYCIEDAQACQKLSKHLVDACNEVLPMRNFNSQASLAKQLLRANLTEPYKTVINKLSAFALKAFNGARIETLQRGYFSCYAYDIVSAYPSVQVNLNKVQNELISNCEYEPDSIHSFFKVDLDIESDIIAPIRYYDPKSNLLLYPNGKIKNHYISKDELELLMKYGFKYKIKDAVHDMGEKEKPYIFMKEIFEKRKKYKKAGSPLQIPFKGALNSSYGITVERLLKPDISELTNFNPLIENDVDVDIFEGNGEKLYYKKKDHSTHAGIFFNPVIGAEITSGVRTKLYQDSIKHEKNIIAFSTDCLTTSKKIKLKFSDKLGFYEDSEKYEGLIIGNGVYSLCHPYDERKNKIKFRGFGKDNVLTIAKDEKNINNSKVDWKKKSPIKLKESRKNNFKNLNVFIHKQKSLDINFDRKRLWDRNPNNFKDLLENQILSKPLTV